MPRLSPQGRTAFWVSSFLLQLASAILLATLAVDISVHILLSALPQLCAAVHCHLLRNYILFAFSFNVVVFALAKRSDRRRNREAPNAGGASIVDEDDDGDSWFDARVEWVESTPVPSASAEGRFFYDDGGRNRSYPAPALGTSPVHAATAGGATKPSPKLTTLHGGGDSVGTAWNTIGQNLPSPSASLFRQANLFSFDDGGADSCPSLTYGTPAATSPVYAAAAGGVMPFLQMTTRHGEDDSTNTMWTASTENPPPTAPFANGANSPTTADVVYGTPVVPAIYDAAAGGIKLFLRMTALRGEDDDDDSVDTVRNTIAENLPPPTAPFFQMGNASWEVASSSVDRAAAAAGTKPSPRTATTPPPQEAEDQSMGPIWKAITEKRLPTAPCLSKCSTWDVTPEVSAEQAAAGAELRRWETFREPEKAPAARRAVLEKRMEGKAVEVFRDYDEMNLRFDAFIKKTKERQRLERLASLRRRMD